MKHCNWFENWFDTPYYHLLYKHRDTVEAEKFIDNLCGLLKPDNGATALDLACGKGRHSIYLNTKGLDVSGFDLSAENIRYAKMFENNTLHFFIRDMRNALGENEFNYVFNLFTSFGYFENENEDVKVLQNVLMSLKTNGIFVLDFLNAEVVKKMQFKQETKTIDSVMFNVSKRIEGQYVVKQIDVKDGAKSYSFYEKVKLISSEWFTVNLQKVGFEIINTFGNYNLEEYKQNSPRVVMVACKR